jgi:hypothetical protein
MPKCKKQGCAAKTCFDSKACEKHSCAKCFGAGKVEVSALVQVVCPVCDGSGLNTAQKMHGWSR